MWTRACDELIAAGYKVTLDLEKGRYSVDGIAKHVKLYRITEIAEELLGPPKY